MPGRDNVDIGDRYGKRLGSLSLCLRYGVAELEETASQQVGPTVC